MPGETLRSKRLSFAGGARVRPREEVSCDSFFAGSAVAAAAGADLGSATAGVEVVAGVDVDDAPFVVVGAVILVELLGCEPAVDSTPGCQRSLGWVSRRDGAI